MASDEYDNNGRYDNMHHMRRDVHDAHTNSQLAKLLSALALTAAVISLALAGYALNKAGEAMSTANRATESVVQRQ